MIISHESKEYKHRWNLLGKNRWNGAYYYSREITKNIIPNVDTDRNWITVNVKGVGCDHAIVFIHNNLHPENYEWLKKYDDIVLVCGVPETVDKVSHIGKAIYVPLSVDVEYVKGFAQDERKGTAFVGRPPKRKGIELPKGIDFIEGIPRPAMLKAMAKYEKVYAVGRTAIEARILGCEILPYDPRYPDPDVWQVRDNSDAAAILQEHLNKIDRGDTGEIQETAPDKEDACVPSMKLTKAELVAVAEDRGVQINSRMNKAQIIDAIEAAT